MKYKIFKVSENMDGFRKVEKLNLDVRFFLK